MLIMMTADENKSEKKNSTVPFYFVILMMQYKGLFVWRGLLR